MTASWKKILVRLCVGIVVVEVLFAYPLGYDFVLNSIGPSTEYLEPWLPTAKTVDGKPTVYIGDDFYVQHTIVRHALNGNPAGTALGALALAELAPESSIRRDAWQNVAA